MQQYTCSYQNYQGRLCVGPTECYFTSALYRLDIPWRGVKSFSLATKHIKGTPTSVLVVYMNKGDALEGTETSSNERTATQKYTFYGFKDLLAVEDNLTKTFQSYRNRLNEDKLMKSANESSDGGSKKQRPIALNSDESSVEEEPGIVGGRINPRSEEPREPVIGKPSAVDDGAAPAPRGAESKPRKGGVEGAKEGFFRATMAAIPGALKGTRASKANENRTAASKSSETKPQSEPAQSPVKRRREDIDSYDAEDGFDGPASVPSTNGGARVPRTGDSGPVDRQGMATSPRGLLRPLDSNPLGDRSMGKSSSSVTGETRAPRKRTGPPSLRRSGYTLPSQSASSQGGARRRAPTGSFHNDDYGASFGRSSADGGGTKGSAGLSAAHCESGCSPGRMTLYVVVMLFQRLCDLWSFCFCEGFLRAMVTLAILWVALWSLGTPQSVFALLIPPPTATEKVLTVLKAFSYERRLGSRDPLNRILFDTLPEETLSAVATSMGKWNVVSESVLLRPWATSEGRHQSPGWWALLVSFAKTPRWWHTVASWVGLGETQASTKYPDWGVRASHDGFPMDPLHADAQGSPGVGLYEQHDVMGEQVGVLTLRSPAVSVPQVAPASLSSMSLMYSMTSWKHFSHVTVADVEASMMELMSLYVKTQLDLLRLREFRRLRQKQSLPTSFGFIDEVPIPQLTQHPARDDASLDALVHVMQAHTKRAREGPEPAPASPSPVTAAHPTRVSDVPRGTQPPLTRRSGAARATMEPEQIREPPPAPLSNTKITHRIRQWNRKVVYGLKHVGSFFLPWRRSTAEAPKSNQIASGTRADATSSPRGAKPAARASATPKGAHTHLLGGLTPATQSGRAQQAFFSQGVGHEGRREFDPETEMYIPLADARERDECRKLQERLFLAKENMMDILFFYSLETNMPLLKRISQSKRKLRNEAEKRFLARMTFLRRHTAFLLEFDPDGTGEAMFNSMYSSSHAGEGDVGSAADDGGSGAGNRASEHRTASGHIWEGKEVPVFSGLACFPEKARMMRIAHHHHQRQRGAQEEEGEVEARGEDTHDPIVTIQSSNRSLLSPSEARRPNPNSHLRPAPDDEHLSSDSYDDSDVDADDNDDEDDLCFFESTNDTSANTSRDASKKVGSAQSPVKASPSALSQPSGSRAPGLKLNTGNGAPVCDLDRECRSPVPSGSPSCLKECLPGDGLKVALCECSADDTAQIASNGSRKDIPHATEGPERSQGGSNAAVPPSPDPPAQTAAAVAATGSPQAKRRRKFSRWKAEVSAEKVAFAWLDALTMYLASHIDPKEVLLHRRRLQKYRIPFFSSAWLTTQLPMTGVSLDHVSRASTGALHLDYSGSKSRVEALTPLRPHTRGNQNWPERPGIQPTGEQHSENVSLLAPLEVDYNAFDLLSDVLQVGFQTSLPLKRIWEVLRGDGDVERDAVFSTSHASDRGLASEVDRGTLTGSPSRGGEELDSFAVSNGPIEQLVLRLRQKLLNRLTTTEKTETPCGRSTVAPASASGCPTSERQGILDLAKHEMGDFSSRVMQLAQQQQRKLEALLDKKKRDLTDDVKLHEEVDDNVDPSQKAFPEKGEALIADLTPELEQFLRETHWQQEKRLLAMQQSHPAGHVRRSIHEKRRLLHALLHQLANGRPFRRKIRTPSNADSMNGAKDSRRNPLYERLNMELDREAYSAAVDAASSLSAASLAVNPQIKRIFEEQFNDDPALLAASEKLMGLHFGINDIAGEMLWELKTPPQLNQQEKVVVSYLRWSWFYLAIFLIAAILVNQLL